MPPALKLPTRRSDAGAGQDGGASSGTVTPRTLEILRLLSHDHFVSGEEIARCVGCSRATVLAEVQHAIAAGLTVHAVRGRGYRLAHAAHWLAPGHLEASLRDTGITLQFFHALESTNTTLLRASQANAAHRTAVLAECQTQGKGRRGRGWLSGLAGGLTFSYLWRSARTAAELSGLSLAVGVMLVRALRDLGLHQAHVKWPNDIVLKQPEISTGTSKLAGVLIELSGDMLSPCTVVIGVGLNVRGAERLTARLDQPVTDLSTHLPDQDRNVVFLSLVRALDAGLAKFEQAGFSAFMSEWEAMHVFQGQEVDVMNALGENTRGIALGVDATGALRLQTGRGEMKFHSGEVSLRGVKSPGARP